MGLARGADLCAADCIHPDAVERTRTLMAKSAAYDDLARLFAALADPTRLRLTHALLHQELCSCDLAAVVGISKSGASQHLKVLKDLRLVRSRREGKYVYHSLDDAHVALLMQVGLTHLGHGQQQTEPSSPLRLQHTSLVEATR